MDKKKQKQYEEELVSFINKHKLVRWSHIDWSNCSFSKRTAYNYELQDLHTIKDAMEENRSRAMNYMLNKWIGSDNATLQIAAMRIVADQDTHRRLNQQYIEHSADEKSIDTFLKQFE